MLDIAPWHEKRVIEDEGRVAGASSAVGGFGRRWEKAQTQTAPTHGFLLDKGTTTTSIEYEVRFAVIRFKQKK